ncbi:hypothetical protein FOZ63_023925, partial [Perkinsus olseni]
PTIDTMRNTVLTTRGQPVDIGLDSELYVFKDQDFVASAFSAALTAGACLGALIAGPVADQIGRRLALMLNSPLGIMAYLTIGLSSNVYLLIAVASVYISEVAPTRLRGILGACNEMASVLGITAVYAAGLLFRTDG